jgi:hypothetical protein
MGAASAKDIVRTYGGGPSSPEVDQRRRPSWGRNAPAHDVIARREPLHDRFVIASGLPLSDPLGNGSRPGSAHDAPSPSIILFDGRLFLRKNVTIDRQGALRD